MEFKKITYTQFTCNLDDRSRRMLENTFKEISNNLEKEYMDAANKELYYSMVSRYVSSHFFKNNINDIPKEGFINIDVNLGNGINIKISLGICNYGDKIMKLNGVIYE